MLNVIWKVSKLNMGVASVRIRALIPAYTMRRRGWRVTITDQRPSLDAIREADAIIVCKSFSADDAWICDTARAAGTPLIVDLCDDLGAGRRRQELDGFLAQAQHAALIVTTGQAMREAIGRYGTPLDKIEIIPDTAETKGLLQDLVRAFEQLNPKQAARIFGGGALHRLRNAVTRRERPLLPAARLVTWFGNAGHKADGVGLECLRMTAPALAAMHAKTPLQLLVITRGHAAFREATRDFPFPCFYREWSIFRTMELLQQSDAVIIPNPDNDAARVKSANRCMLALSCGAPVIASRLPALDEFADCLVLDDWDKGLQRYLCDEQAAWRDVARGRELIGEKYSVEQTAARWTRLLEDVARRRPADTAKSRERRRPTDVSRTSAR